MNEWMINEHGALVQKYGKGSSIYSTEDLSKYHFGYHKCHMDCFGTEPDPQRSEAANYRLCY